MKTIYCKSNRPLCIWARVCAEPHQVTIEWLFFNPKEGSAIQRETYTFNEYPELADIVEEKHIGTVWNPLLLDELVNVYEVTAWLEPQKAVAG